MTLFEQFKQAEKIAIFEPGYREEKQYSQDSIFLSEEVEFLNPDANSGIYFLVLKNAVIYIGQTKKKVVDRIYMELGNRSNHSNCKPFDSVYFIPFEPNELNNIEKEFIQLFLPKFNYVNKKLTDTSKFDTLPENYRLIHKKVYNHISEIINQQLRGMGFNL